MIAHCTGALLADTGHELGEQSSRNRLLNITPYKNKSHNFMSSCLSETQMKEVVKRWQPGDLQDRLKHSKNFF